MRSFALFLARALACAALALSSVSAQELGEDGTPYPPLEESSAEVALSRLRVGPSLLSKLNSNERIPVIISLAHQPSMEIAEEEQAAFSRALREREEEALTIHRKYSTGARAATAEEASVLARQEASLYSKADRARLQKIAAELKLLKDQMRLRILQRIREAVAAEQSEVASFVRGLGGTVTYTYDFENTVAARVPGSALSALADHPLVRYVVEDQKTEADLDISVPALGTQTFWNAGETGGNWYNATMDTGVDTGHPNMGRTNGWWQVVRHDTGSGDSSYNDNSSSTDDLQGHGTHVAGIMNSNHATFRGVAFGSTRSTNLKAGWRSTTGRASMYRSDAMSAMNWGLTNAVIDVVNLSFGANYPMTDDDDDYIRFWDGLVHSQNIVLSKSAGNEGGTGKTLTTPAGTYNGIVVANLDDRGTLTRADDIINSGSSRGPTPNGRKKPDLAAPGTAISAPNHNWEGTNPDFVNMTGTSMAAPHVGGAATLLHDVGITDPRAVKAVLINTADFLPGQTTWNNSAGWGYVNLDRAYLRRTNWFLHTVTPWNTSGEYRLYRVPNPQVGDKTTMVWNRRVNWNGANFPTTWHALSDLNLRYYVESSGAVHASSLSSIDNVEQVIANTTEPLIIKAYSWSTSFAGGVSAETFALAVPPGTTAVTGPNLSAGAASSSYSRPLNAKFRVLLRVSNTGDINAPGCTVSISLPAGVQLVSGSLTTSAGSAPAGGQTDWVEVWLRATTAGTKTVNVSGTCDAFGITWPVAGSSFTINPGPADTVAPFSALQIGGVEYRSGGVELIANGGFESNWGGWVTSGTASIETGSAASGSRNAKLGPGSGSASQTLTISNSASRALLSFSYKSSTAILASVSCTIRDGSGNLLVTAFSTSASQPAWTGVTVDISRFRGQTIQVRFSSGSGLFGDSTLWVDDVSVKEGESVWVGDASATMVLRSADNAAGVDFSGYQVAGGPWQTYSSPFALAQQGANSINYYSVDNSNNVEPTISTVVNLDSVPPASVLRVGTPRVLSGGTEKVASNAGFESGLIGWDASGDVSTVTSPVRSGNFAARVGGTGSGTLTRDVSIRASATTAIASAWVRAAGGSGLFAFYSASIADPETGQVLDAGISGSSGSITDWTQVVWDVSRFRGKTVRLRFHASALGTGYPTLYVDDVSVKEDAGLYVTPSTTLRIGSFDHVGVEVYQRSIDGGAFTDGQTFSISTPGRRTLAYRARDLMGKTETATVTELTVDSAGPSGSVTINGGAAFTTSRNVTLSLSASDPSTVSLMRIRNSGEEFGAWQAFATSKPWTLTDGGGTKTVIVQYQDGLGNISAEYLDSIEYIPPVVVPIGDAKLLGPHPVAITLAGKRVSGVFLSKNMFYIQEADRSAGIKVNRGALPVSPGIGQAGTFEGVIQLDSNGEPELYLTAFTPGSAGPAPIPLGLTNRALGGGPWGDYIPGVTSGQGLHNVGLLVRTWGTVTARDTVAMTIRIDDGSALADGGVLVDMSQAGALPAPGARVQVTGNLGCVLSGSSIRPVIRARSAADVTVF